MRKAWTVAKTEYLAAVRSKAFIVGLAVTPLIVVLAIGLQHFAEKKKDLTDQRFVVVDESGVLAGPIHARLEEHNRKGVLDEQGVQVRPKLLAVPFDVGKLERQPLELELSEKVRSGGLFAFVIIEKHVMDPQAATGGAVSYYSQTPTARDLPDWLMYTLQAEVRRLRFAEAGLDEQLVEKLNVPAAFAERGLVQAEAGGGVSGGEVKNRATSFAVPFGAMYLLFILLMMSSPALLNTVLEEKIQRISELLVASISPFELMLGKVLGTVLVSATLSAIYIGALVFVADRLDFLKHIPQVLFIAFPVFLMLALMMYGSIFAAIGAACNEIRDAQTMMTPAMMVLILPLICAMPIINAPNSSLAVGLSLFAPATPMLMMLRLATSPGPPMWQVALGLVLTLAFTIFCIWAGGKVFRVGILSHGQPPNYRKLLSWVFSNQT